MPKLNSLEAVLCSSERQPLKCGAESRVVGQTSCKDGSLHLLFTSLLLACIKQMYVSDSRAKAKHTAKC